MMMDEKNCATVHTYELIIIVSVSSSMIDNLCIFKWKLEENNKIIAFVWRSTRIYENGNTIDLCLISAPSNLL